MPAEALDNTHDHRAPLLVLLPGTLCDERLFTALLERLPSLPRFLYTNANARTLAEDAAHLLALCPRPMILVGFSLGGILALEIALRAPALVRGLILLSTTARPVPPEHHATRRAAVTTARQLGPARFTREHLWPTYIGLVSNAAHLPLLEAMATSLGADTFARQTELALARRDLRPHLHAITCPTLILAGDADRVCPPAVQHELAAIPHSSLTLLPGAGHLLPLEQPDEVASHVAAWFHLMQKQSQEIE